MKIAIVGGAGGIGASAAFNLLRSEHLSAEVVLVDNRPHMVTSHVMDLADTVSLGQGLGVSGGDLADAVDADVVVVSAAVPLRLNTSRSVFLTDNARVLQEVVAPLVRDGFAGVLLVMTNPVDPLLTWVHEAFDLPAERLLGYTLNDQLRLRSGVARALAVAPQRVGGWVVGEHGEHQVPLYDRLTLDGDPVSLAPAERAVAQDYIDTWYTTHVALDSGRTSTWSSGLGVTRMIEAMVVESPEPFPGSSVLAGEYAVDGVAVSAPLHLDPGGRTSVEVWDLDAEQLAAVSAGAHAVRTATDAIHSALDRDRV